MALTPKAIESLKVLQYGTNQPGGFENQFAGRLAADNQLTEMKRNLGNQAQFPMPPAPQPEVSRSIGGLASITPAPSPRPAQAPFSMSGASPADVTDLEQSLNEDPQFGQAAQARTAQTGKDYNSAVAQGFRGQDPVREYNEYQRKQAEAKINAPIEQQRVAGQADIEKQRLASQGALDVAKENQSGIAARYGAIQDILQGGGGGGNLRSVNPTSGAMSFGAPPAVPAAIDRDVTTARQNYEKVKSQAWFGGGNEEALAKAQLDGAIASALARHHADPTFKQFAQQIANDPRYDQMSLPEILHSAGEDNLSPDEMNDLQNLLYITRGK